MHRLATQNPTQLQTVFGGEFVQEDHGDIQHRYLPPSDVERPNTELTKREKVIAVLLLLFYLAMIGVTIATSPFVSNIQSQGVFDRAGNSL